MFSLCMLIVPFEESNYPPFFWSNMMLLANIFWVLFLHAWTLSVPWNIGQYTAITHFDGDVYFYQFSWGPAGSTENENKKNSKFRQTKTTTHKTHDLDCPPQTKPGFPCAKHHRSSSWFLAVELISELQRPFAGWLTRWRFTCQRWRLVNFNVIQWDLMDYTEDIMSHSESDDVYGICRGFKGYFNGMWWVICVVNTSYTHLTPSFFYCFFNDVYITNWLRLPIMNIHFFHIPTSIDDLHWLRALPDWFAKWCPIEFAKLGAT